MFIILRTFSFFLSFILATQESHSDNASTSLKNPASSRKRQGENDDTEMGGKILKINVSRIDGIGTRI